MDLTTRCFVGRGKVLCVWVGNISRSPMRQAVLQPLLGDGFRVERKGQNGDRAAEVAFGKSGRP